MPPDVVQALVSIRETQACGAIWERIKKVLGRKPLPADLSTQDLVNAVCLPLDALWSQQLRNPATTYEALWRFTVSNRGYQPAKDVLLDTPLSGVADVAGSGEPTNPKQLQLGELRPGASITVDIWTTNRFPLDFFGGARLTHASGIGSIRQDSRLSGWRAIVGNYIELIVMALITILAIVSLVAARSERAQATSAPSA
jgi:hypothetical protein